MRTMPVRRRQASAGDLRKPDRPTRRTKERAWTSARLTRAQAAPGNAAASEIRLDADKGVNSYFPAQRGDGFAFLVQRLDSHSQKKCACAQRHHRNDVSPHRSSGKSALGPLTEQDPPHGKSHPLPRPAATTGPTPVRGVPMIFMRRAIYWGPPGPWALGGYLSFGG